MPRKPVHDGITWLLDGGTARDVPAGGLGLSGYADVIAAARGSEESVQHECAACNAGLPCTDCGAARQGSEFQLHDGKAKPAKQPPRNDAATPEKKAQQHQQACYDKCGGTERGSIECKLGADGLPTAELDTTIRETDPCTRPCVEKHEAIHASDIAPVCRAVADCLKKAGNDRGKQGRCLDVYEANLYAMVAGSAGTECKAYGAELDCLNARKGVKECKDGDGPKRWAKSVERTGCYQDCFCAKPR